jgi:hypothetical protein
LREAYKRFLDPAVLNEWIEWNRRLRAEGKWHYSGTPREIEGYELSPIDAHGHELLRQKLIAGKRLQQSFIDKLIDGQITAWARLKSPLAPWTEIPAAAWRMLSLGDLDASTVNSPEGEVLYDVRIGARHVALPEPVIPGKRGRPSSAPLILEEFRHRLARGEVGDVLRVEAAILAAWYRRTHLDKTPAKAKSVEETIRPEFNVAKGKSSKAEPRPKTDAKSSPEPTDPQW